MADVLLPGITATRLDTGRLTQSVLHPEGVDPVGPGEAVLFVHGNVSSALFWQQPLLALAETGRYRPLAVDLRGYGDTDPLPVDARRGMRDWADDIGALVGALGLDRVHLVGWSMAPVWSCSTCSTRRSRWRRWPWWRRCPPTGSAVRQVPTVRGC